MPTRTSLRNLTMPVVSLALMLGSCGGDEKAKPAIPVSASTPAPTPTPTGTSSPSISDFQKFGALGQVSDTQFTSFSFGYRYRSIDDGWNLEVEPNSINPDRDAGIRFVPPDRIFLTIDGQSEASLIANGGGGYSDGVIVAASYNAGPAYVYLDAPILPTGKQLRYTLRGVWSIDDQVGQPYPSYAVPFVYGLPTSAKSVPSAGSFAYDLSVVPGSIEVNFMDGTISGKLGIGSDKQDLQYQLADVTFTPDRTGFAGEVVELKSGSKGQIDGRWTGPNAEEFMAKLVFQIDRTYFVLLLKGGQSFP